MTKRFWRCWKEKLFTQLISLKFWVFLIAVVLVVSGFITGGELVTLTIAVMTLRGGIEIAAVIKEKPSCNTPTPTDNNVE